MTDHVLAALVKRRAELSGKLKIAQENRNRCTRTSPAWTR